MSGRNLLLFGFKDRFPPNSFSLQSSLIKTFMGASHIIKTIYFLSVLLKEFLSLSVCQRISKDIRVCIWASRFSAVSHVCCFLMECFLSICSSRLCCLDHLLFPLVFVAQRGIAPGGSNKRALTVFRTLYWGLFSFHSGFLSPVFPNGGKLKLQRPSWLCISENWNNTVFITVGNW